MSTHGHGRPRGRRRGGRRRAGSPPPETPDQDQWDDQQPPDDPNAYGPPGYPPPGTGDYGQGQEPPPPGRHGHQPPGQDAPGYGYQAAPRDPAGYGHQTPPQDPAGYGYPPPDQPPGGHQPPPVPGGYGQQLPDQAGYGQQAPGQDPSGHQPPLAPGGYGQGPDQDPQGRSGYGHQARGQDPGGYGQGPDQDPQGRSGYGHRAPGQASGGYGHHAPPQDPAGYGHQPPAQDTPGYGHQASPREPGGYGHQAPPQDPAGYGQQPPGDPGDYGHQALPHDPAGYGYPPPTQDPQARSGYGHQAPGQVTPGYGHQAPQDSAGYGQPAQDSLGHRHQAPPDYSGHGQPPAPDAGEHPAPPPPPGPSGPSGPPEGRRRRARSGGAGAPPGHGAPAGHGTPPGGGRRARRAEQQRKTQRKGKRGGIDLKALVPVPLLVTLAVLAVFVGVGELTLPEDRSQLTGLEPATASVTASRLVCPDAAGRDVGVVAPGSGKGEVTVQPIGSSTGSPLGSLRQAPGRAVVQPSGSDAAVVASAEGGTAQGFEAEQYSRKDKGADRGLSDVRCVTPTTNWWFTGAATTGGNQTDLFLSNIDRSAATVDILAYGNDGAIDPEAGRGITVDPGQRMKVNLTELAPELPVTAVRVVARTGRVAASMRTQVKDGNTSYGASWVPPSAPRKGNLVVPAVPSGAGERKLVLFSPSEQDATVNVRLSTPDGSFAPAGHDKVDVPAQQAIEVDLGDVMSKNATALQLSSEIPLVAAVVAAEGGSGEDGDVAYSAGSASLSSPATVAYVPASKVSATLQLTAPTKDAEVELRALTSKVSGPKRVKIGAGKTVPVKLSGPSGESNYGVSITQLPGSGPVYGSRVLTASPSDGPLLTVLPLQPGVREVTLPPVVPEVGAGVPR